MTTSIIILLTILLLGVNTLSLAFYQIFLKPALKTSGKENFDIPKVEKEIENFNISISRRK